jgi:hypothetical protein
MNGRRSVAVEHPARPVAPDRGCASDGAIGGHTVQIASRHAAGGSVSEITASMHVTPAEVLCVPRSRHSTGTA